MRRLGVTAATALLVVASCSSGGPSTKATTALFCTRLERLTQNDPFQAFGDRATAKDIQAAFSALVQRARELADTAPAEVRPTARAYATATTKLDSLMAGAAYDGAAVDARAYRDAQNDYTRPPPASRATSARSARPHTTTTTR